MRCQMTERSPLTASIQPAERRGSLEPAAGRQPATLHLPELWHRAQRCTAAFARAAKAAFNEKTIYM